jgi:hypothetical protein
MPSRRGANRVELLGIGSGRIAYVLNGVAAARPAGRTVFRSKMSRGYLTWEFMERFTRPS